MGKAPLSPRINVRRISALLGIQQSVHDQQVPLAEQKKTR